MQITNQSDSAENKVTNTDNVHGNIASLENNRTPIFHQTKQKDGIMNEVSAKPEKEKKERKKRWLYIEPFKPVESELKQKNPPDEAVSCLHHSYQTPPGTGSPLSIPSQLSSQSTTRFVFSTK